MKEVTGALRYFLDRHNIEEREGVSLVLVTNRIRTAGAIEMALRQDFDPLCMDMGHRDDCVRVNGVPILVRVLHSNRNVVIL